MLTITCPHCGFAKQTDPERVPDRPVRITCPRCGDRFQFTKENRAEPPGDPGQETEQETTPAGESGHWPETPSPSPATEEQTPASEEKEVVATLRCSACGLEQSVGDRCRGCGSVFVLPAAGEEFAGFWIRFIAAIVDSVLVTLIQVILGFALGLTAGALGGLGGNGQAMAFTTWLFGTVLAIAYYVVFTGHGGQTPGKMAVRVKVIRTDGSEVGYGRAALREVLGKFISGILFGIGYLMVAFDRRKQGLHDKIADTYVIKL